MVIYLEWWKVKGLTAGERIMQLRTDRKYTREQLACLADISEQFKPNTLEMVDKLLKAVYEISQESR